MLNIKDPRAHELAREVARAEGTSLTAAVISALETRLQSIRREADREARVRRIKQASARIRAAVGPEGPMSDDELYDEWGLPK